MRVNCIGVDSANQYLPKTESSNFIGLTYLWSRPEILVY